MSLSKMLRHKYRSAISARSIVDDCVCSFGRASLVVRSLILTGCFKRFFITFFCVVLSVFRTANDLAARLIFHYTKAYKDEQLN